MYARQLVFKSSAGRRGEIEKLADQAFALMTSLKGFLSVHFLVSDDETQYSSFSLWETKADAESGGAAITAKTTGSLKELALEPPEFTLYEIYKPKT